MKIEGLSKDELISNLKIFKDTGASVSSPERACFVGDGLLLLGGGFRVLDQPPGGGNFQRVHFLIQMFHGEHVRKITKFLALPRLQYLL